MKPGTGRCWTRSTSGPYSWHCPRCTGRTARGSTSRRSAPRRAGTMPCSWSMPRSPSARCRSTARASARMRCSAQDTSGCWVRTASGSRGWGRASMMRSRSKRHGSGGAAARTSGTSCSIGTTISRTPRASMWASARTSFSCRWSWRHSSR